VTSTLEKGKDHENGRRHVSEGGGYRDIKGESKDHKYKEWIDVLAWSWGVTQSGSMHIGGGGGSGKCNVQDINFTKYVDAASTNLMLKCCNGKHYPEAKLVVRKAGEKPVEYMKITLTDVLVTGYQTGGSGGEDRLTENVTLNFAKLKVEYTLQSKSGAAEASQTVEWSCEENTGG
jgi:type VI secretion system secreted protein Hcp